MNLYTKILVIGMSALFSMQVQAMQEVHEQALKRSEQEMAKLFPQTSASELSTSVLTSQSAKNNYFMELIIKSIGENNIDKVSNQLNQGLKQGFDINTQDIYGYTVLNFAACFGTSAMVELLLKAGANPNIKDNDGLTSLHMALVSDRPDSLDILKILINAGANVNTKDNKGLSFLNRSIEVVSPSIVKFLLKLPGVSLPEKKEAAALFAKLRNKNPESEQKRIDLQEMIKLLSPYAMALTDLSVDAIVKNIDLYRDKLHLLPQELQEEVKRRLGLAGDLICMKARLKSTTKKYT